MKILNNEHGYTAGERQFILYQYLLDNTSKDNVVKPKDMLGALANEGIKISINTLYSDLAVITRTMAPLDYNESLKGWWITKRDFTQSELRIMVDCIQAAKFIPQKTADQITHKIGSLTDRYSRSALRRLAYIENRVRNTEERIFRDTDKIYSAIEQNKKIAFKFYHYDRNRKKVYSKNGDMYIVSPYAMIWRGSYYYLYALVDGENRWRYFRIDRMENITKPLLENRAGSKEYSSKNITKTNVKVFGIREGKNAQVKIRFNNGLVDAVRDEFGREITMFPHDEKNFYIVADVRLNMDFYSWIFSFGRGAEILAPKAVADKMCEYAQNIAEMYNNREV